MVVNIIAIGVLNFITEEKQPMHARKVGGCMYTQTASTVAVDIVQRK